MRRTLASLASLASLLVSLAGCQFYFGGDDDDCLFGGGAGEGDKAPAVGVRNPQTGLCEFYGGGGTCDDRCGPCPGAADEAQPSWGLCESYCSGLDEATCAATAGCRGAYLDDCPPGADCGPALRYHFVDCWAVDMTGPVQGGGCAGLDAYECSRHDDCGALHSQQCDPATPPAEGGGAPIAECPIGTFETCIDETPTATGCYSDAECPDGSHCNAAEVCRPPPGCGGTPAEGDAFVPCPDACYGECVPGDPGDVGSCTGDVLCDRATPACPAGTTPGIKDGCYTGYCIPLDRCGVTDPGSCDGAVLCDSTPPECPAGTTPGISGGCWSGFCIPLERCRPERGVCYGPVYCDVAPPECGPGATPGVADGCYTGYCIPLAECEPTADCSTIYVESACIARTDCAPLYAGVDCSCGPDGACDCADWRFVACSYRDI